jgi:hypothetical protein
MEWYYVTAIVILWYISGFYGTLILFRTLSDVVIADIVICFIGGISGPLMLFIGLATKYNVNTKVIFKKYPNE